LIATHTTGSSSYIIRIATEVFFSCAQTEKKKNTTAVPEQK